MKNILLLACLSSPFFATATAIGFEVLPMPAGFTSIEHLNHRGDYVGFAMDGVRSNVGGVVTTRSLISPTGLPVTEVKVSENGWLYGYAGAYGGFNDYRPLVARPDESWRQFQASQANAVGVTGAGKVLLRLGPSGAGCSWWDPVLGTNTSVTGFPVSAGACNLAGDAIYHVLGWYGRTGEAPFQLQYQGLSVSIRNLNEQGDVAGGAYQTINGGINSAGVLWDRHGNIVLSVPSPAGASLRTIFYDVNNLRQLVGIRAAGPTSSEATYYSAETGLVSINSNLTPTSSGYSFGSAEKISDNGLILAFGRGPGDSTNRYYLLRVVPEPASMAVLGVGLLGVLRSRRSGRKNPKTSC